MRNAPSRRGSAKLYTMLALLALAPATALGQRAGRGANNPVRNIPVNGVAANGQTFTGQLSIQRFQAHGDTLVAVGELSGKFSDGKPVVQQAVSWPVQSIQGNAVGAAAALGPNMQVLPATWNAAGAPTVIQAQQVCDILNLVLGPLHLDLLGLVVDLNQVVLDITAVGGPGNLLGNLLCAIVGLFDPAAPAPPTTGALAAALTNLVNALNGLIAALPI